MILLILISLSCTVELEQMLESSGQNLGDVLGLELDSAWGEAGSGALRRHAGSGSGGYADHVFLHAAEQLFGESNAQLVYKNLRLDQIKTLHDFVSGFVCTHLIVIA